MSRVSLRENLDKIGELHSDKPSIHIPSGFHSAPKSLKATIKAMNSPRMESWAFGTEDKLYGHEWTEECQGITTDGKCWFVVSNNENDSRIVYKFDLMFRYQHKIKSPCGTDHIGAPCFFDNKIYVPVEGTDKARIWILDTDFTSSNVFMLGGTKEPEQRAKMPWCAINPLNGYLYSSVFADDREDEPPVDRVFSYDPRDNFVQKETFMLQGEGIHRVQGGCFSDNGHLYLSSSKSVDIKGYSVLNGKYLGRYSPPSDWSEDEEMEGISLWPVNYEGAIETYVHMVVLDNDVSVNDDVYFKHIKVPSPEYL
jgi:hypothetical protein